MNKKALLRKLFDLWTKRRPLEPIMFSDDFVYDCGSTIFTTKDWLTVNEVLVPPTDVKLITLQADDDTDAGILVFEFDDPVTLLHHRVSWAIVFKGGLIAKIAEVDPQRRADRKPAE